MSGIGDERWRNSRGQPPSQSQPSQGPKQGASRKGSYNNINSSNNSQEKSSEKPDSVNAMASASAWTNDRNKGDARSAAPDPQAATAGYKAQDTRDFFKTAFASVSSEDPKALRYKATLGPASTKTGGAWASKPNTIGYGKDFFLELRKQVSALQQSERAGG